MAAVWEVVGGSERGGIIVRTGCDLSSDLADGRLATGSVVKEIDAHEGRICYELLQGEGPASGWVSPSLRGKELLIKTDQTHADNKARQSRRRGFSQWASLKAEESSEVSTDAMPDLVPAETAEMSSESPASGAETPALVSEALAPVSAQVPEKGLSEDDESAFQKYIDKIGECRDGSNPGYSRKAFPWFNPKPQEDKSKKLSTEALEAALACKPKQKKLAKDKLWEVDSEGEEVPLCPRCSLPVGEFAYQGREGKQACVHTECMAQVMTQEAQREEDARVKRENVKKEKNRREYDIGWRMDSVPKSAPLAERMGCMPAPQGLCCLVLDEASRTVKVAATAEPSCAVNLEYLLLALKVRKTASREPLFSLDPVDPQNLEKTPQKKVYEPSWLAGTSVGDVMFQADYFLKELALGEYDMPVVGMLSVFDWSEMKDKDKSWAGREWYVVKKAEIRMAEDNTLIPHVKMGVEAREQVVTKKGLEDAPVTLPHHPLKKFADAFTRNFDLIAERKSVVFHLRELAKASTMAKYLIDSKARLDPTWYRLADEIVKATEPEPYPQIPQLWNMRGNSRIKLKEGRLVDMVTGGQSNLQAIYGGVEFGLDRFELAQRHALAGQKPSVPGVQLAQSGRPMFMPQRFQLGQRPEMPQGVDLNLDKFSLSTEERFVGRLPPCSGGPDSLEARTILGKAFLQGLRQKSFAVKPEDQSLLLNIYSVPQCDRVEEGDAFIPPDPNLEYLTKVRSLVGEEKTLRERRRQKFSDKSFAVTNPGLDFPRSWTPRFQVEMEGRAQTAPTKFGLKKLEVDEAFKRGLLENVLPAAAPEFNQVTEDGIAFRIYKIGSLEVRTTQEVDGQEAIAVVFSSGTASWEAKAVDSEDALGRERLVKCKVYVEAMEQEPQLHLAKDARAGCNFYIVLETEKKNRIVTEALGAGNLSWVQNPNNLEDRNSLAKLLFTVDCKDDLHARDLKQFQRTLILPPSVNLRKHYAKAIYKFVSGRSFRGKWGGNLRRYAPPMPPQSGNLGLAALGRSSDFLNVMWLARKSSNKADLLKPKIPY